MKCMHAESKSCPKCYAEGTRCSICGDQGQCNCSATYDVSEYPYSEAPIADHWSAFTQRLINEGDSGSRGRYLFCTLTFGCTKCACITGALCHLRSYQRLSLTSPQLEYAEKWTECKEEIHDYLKPGPQMGRKRFKQFFDEYIPEGINITHVYGAEERGAAFGRLHYHAVLRCHSDVSNYDLAALRRMWIHGFSKWEIIYDLKASLDYVTKYTTKTQLQGQPYAPPFFFFRYEPNLPMPGESGNMDGSGAAPERDKSDREMFNMSEDQVDALMRER